MKEISLSIAMASCMFLASCGGSGDSLDMTTSLQQSALTVAPHPAPNGATGAISTTSANVIYAQGMGTTETDGLVKSFPLMADDLARRVWVDAVNGDDANNGFSPTSGCRLNGTGTFGQIGATGCSSGSRSGYGPKRSYMAAVRLFPVSPAHGIGNQILLGEGDAFIESEDVTNADNLVYRNGYSVQFPRIVESYDKKDPLNEQKMGRAVGANRPKLKSSLVQSGLFLTLYTYQTQKVDTTIVGNFAIRGIALEAPSASQSGGIGMGGGGNPQNILIENVVGDHVGIGIGGSDGNNAKNVIIRKSSMGWNWDLKGSHSAALGTGHIDALVVEDCIIYHAGWNTDRNATDGSGADIFKQGFYASYGSADQSISRRNVIIDGSASGLSGRGSMNAYNNVLIDNPVQAVAGGSVSNYSLENPNGVLFNYDHNLIIGGADITSSLLRGEGISLQNGRQGSTANYNLFVNGHQPTLSYAFVFYNSAKYNQPSYAELKGNRAYAFSANFNLGDAVPSAYPAQTLTSEGTVRTVLSGAATDDNVNMPTSPATNLQIYAAAGYPAIDEATAKKMLIADMVVNPDRPWAYLLMKSASTLFGNFDFGI